MIAIRDRVVTFAKTWENVGNLQLPRALASEATTLILSHAKHSPQLNQILTISLHVHQSAAISPASSYQAPASYYNDHGA